jgi:hypothetical protein
VEVEDAEGWEVLSVVVLDIVVVEEGIVLGKQKSDRFFIIYAK